ncbi:MAG: serine/threonine protein kinase, partial [Actinobacteria bacterium]|nr:serine/threonine protein kinase [Actinomycetota bacterium]
LAQATIEPRERAALRIDILAAALAEVLEGGAVPGASVGGVPAAEAELRTGLETAYREAASLEPDRQRRVQLVDQANRVRVRTLT